ncbi:MAG: TadE/TadG family type IV pilus assembly protein [Pararhizobium sp.]
MQAIWSCRRGNFALLFALAVVPIFGAAGIAVDYSRAVSARCTCRTSPTKPR